MEYTTTRERLDAAVVGHLRNAGEATRVVKGILLLGGSLIAGVAQFLDIKPEGIAPNQMVGIGGCVAVFLAALWGLLNDRDSSDELKIAFEAQSEAEQVLADRDQLLSVYDDLERSANLIVANNLIRGFLENVCVQDASMSDDTAMVEAIFSVAGRYLALAMGLSGSDEWTVCAYKALGQPSGKDRLVLVAHNRAISCEKSEAREWEEGVGVAGICYSTEREIIVPDFQGDGVGSLFNVGPRTREYDASRYQSIISVPIQIDGLSRPWGVVTATSDRRYHFTPEDTGMQHAEGARVLAGAIALAIAIRRGLANAPKAA